ncbi:MAG: DUF364 domain-containing protein [Chloroflexota bacterium]
MNLLKEIYSGLPDAKVERVCIGMHWTAVVVELDGVRRCGLGSNPVHDFRMNDENRAKVIELEKQSARELCQLTSGNKPPFTSVGLAAINALLPYQPERWTERNAGDVIAQMGKGKKVALIGHFPFVPELQQQVGKLDVLELRPKDGDLDAREAPRIIPNSEVVAITSMAFINGTMDGLLSLCSPDAYVIILGPGTPLSPLLFNHGIDMLCGSIVVRIDPVLDGIISGNGFQKIKPLGVRLVTMVKQLLD